jgi:hypothetical protein
MVSGPVASNAVRRVCGMPSSEMAAFLYHSFVAKPRSLRCLLFDSIDRSWLYVSQVRFFWTGSGL